MIWLALGGGLVSGIAIGVAITVIWFAILEALKDT